MKSVYAYEEIEEKIQKGNFQFSANSPGEFADLEAPEIFLFLQNFDYDVSEYLVKERKLTQEQLYTAVMTAKNENCKKRLVWQLDAVLFSRYLEETGNYALLDSDMADIGRYTFYGYIWDKFDGDRDAEILMKVIHSDALDYVRKAFRRRVMKKEDLEALIEEFGIECLEDERQYDQLSQERLTQIVRKHYNTYYRERAAYRLIDERLCAELLTGPLRNKYSEWDGSVRKIKDSLLGKITDQEALKRVAMFDRIPNIRRNALYQCMGDQEFLKKYIMHETDYELVALAINRLEDRSLLKKFLPGKATYAILEAIAKDRDETVLAYLDRRGETKEYLEIIRGQERMEAALPFFERLYERAYGERFNYRYPMRDSDAARQIEEGRTDDERFQNVRFENFGGVEAILHREYEDDGTMDEFEYIDSLIGGGTDTKYEQKQYIKWRLEKLYGADYGNLFDR